MKVKVVFPSIFCFLMQGYAVILDVSMIIKLVSDREFLKKRGLMHLSMFPPKGSSSEGTRTGAARFVTGNYNYEAGSMTGISDS